MRLLNYALLLALRAGGFTLAEMREAGFTWRACTAYLGATYGQLRRAGFKDVGWQEYRDFLEQD